MMGFRGMWLAAVMAAALLGSGRLHADPHGHDESHGHGDRHDHDHDDARGAVERGEIRPLAELLATVRDKLPGEIAGVEIERKHGIWVYEFRVVDKSGRLLEVTVDGNSGDIKRTRQR